MSDIEIFSQRPTYGSGIFATHDIAYPRQHAMMYGEWIQKNCIVSRNGFRLLPSIKEEISNEKAYELYLESLKSK